MRFFNGLFILMIFCVPVSAQVLFEEDTSKKVDEAPVVQINPVNQESPVVHSSSNTVVRLLSTNLESVIARGDIQFLYESPQNNGWSTMVFLHANPQSEFNHQTGDLGAMIGGRSYLDNYGKQNSVFLQGLVGFNHNNKWDLMISVEVGQRIVWKKNIFLDLSLAMNRSYATSSSDPMAYLKANLTFELNRRLIPFL
tara:strand:- start:1355 stop:1945 length:591 start_codon:yes stop_codon:yes gene_type:complete